MRVAEMKFGRSMMVIALIGAAGAGTASARERHRRPRAHVVSSYQAPLMPAREWEGVSLASIAPASGGGSGTVNPHDRSTASNGGEGFRLGFAGGTLAHVGALPYDALNSQLYYGGRVAVLAPLTETIWLRPSVGYFFRNENGTMGNALQNLFEGNVNLQYAGLGGAGWYLLLGVTQSLQMGFSRVSGSTLSNNTPIVFSYHAGPSLGLLFDLNSGIALTIDSEVTFDFSSPVVPFVGLTGGLLFRL